MFGFGSKSKRSKKSSAKSTNLDGSNSQLDKDIVALMVKMNIPQTARDGVLKLPVAQKQIMLKQYQQQLAKAESEPKHSGKEWSKKMIDAQSVNWKLLKEFEVIIKSPEAGATFCTEFIQELGLKRLCRVSREHTNTQFDIQILLIFKAIIDSKQTIIRDIINDDQSVTTIVSKMDSSDHRVREHAIKLLVTLVIAEDANLSLLAASKIMASLLDSARLKGYRNRWKSVICHLSVNELSGHGSYEYDTYSLTLINFIISGLESIEERTDERRLLNSLKLNASLDKLQTKIEDLINTEPLQRAISVKEPDSPSVSNNSANYDMINHSNSMPTNSAKRKVSSHKIRIDDQVQYWHSVLNQISAYNTLREEDLNELRKAGIIDDENDLSSPKGLFKVLHDQCLDDGFINDFTSILKNLITIPASGDMVWTNLAKIVQEACKPTQQKYASHKSEDEKEEKNTYLSFKELQHLLKVQKVEEEKEKEIEEKHNEIEIKLNEERKKVSEFEKQVQELQNIITDLKSGAIGNGGGLPPPMDPEAGLSNGLPPPHTGGLPAPIPNGGGGLGGLPPPPQSPPIAAPIPVQNANANADDGLTKYRKMIKMSVPKPAVINKMKQDKIDNAIIMKYELTGQLPDAPSSSSSAAAPAPAPIPAAAVQDDGLDKFRKMLKMKVPKAAIVNKMKQAKVDNAIIMKFELTGNLPQGSTNAAAAPAPIPNAAPAPAPAPAKQALTAEEEKALSKYSKMKKMNIPEAAIRNKMRQDKIDKALVAKFFGESVSVKAPSLGGPKKPIKPKWPENLKKKAEIKPKRKMKNFQWNKIDPFAVEKSIWKEVDDTKIKFDFDDFENMFGQKVIAKKQSKSGGGGRKKKAAVEKIHILEGKRSYNIEIFLGRLKMKPDVCKNILLNMDEKKFNAEQVSKLKNFTPTPEEATMFDGLETDDIANLAKAEHFFYVIRNIDKNIPQRLELWAFKMNFDKILAVEREKVTALRDAHKCIKQSKSLRDLFSLILAFGNYMNGGTRKGQAHGFKLKSLSQLTRSRSTDNKTTLMEYLYLYLLENNKDLLNFIDEWSSLESAVSVDVPTLRGAINQIKAKLNLINNRTKSAGTNSLATDQFASVMKPFYESASKQFESVQKMHGQVMKDLCDLALFLNEKNDKTGLFLKTLNEFRKQFKFTMKQCDERKKREEEKKKREQWKANKKKGTKQNNASPPKPPKPPKSIVMKSGGGGLPPPIDEDEVDDVKESDVLNIINSNRGGLPPPHADGNKSDQRLAALMRSDSSALMDKLRARRKKMSVTSR